jgi:hypothetical protein
MSRVSENLRILEGLAEAFNEHDLDRIMDFFSDDCSLDMPRAGPMGNAPHREGGGSEGAAITLRDAAGRPLRGLAALCY